LLFFVRVGVNFSNLGVSRTIGLDVDRRLILNIVPNVLATFGKGVTFNIFVGCIPGANIKI